MRIGMSISLTALLASGTAPIPPGTVTADGPIAGIAALLAGEGSLLQPINPATLFAAGEFGIWIDPSDNTTIFSDVNGVTQAASGASAAIALDKSQGLTKGVEKVTNGSFTTDTAWTKGTGWTISGGTANKTSGNQNALSQALTGIGTANRVFEITFTLTRTAGAVQVGFTGGSGSSLGPSYNASGTYTFLLIANSGNTTLSVLPTSTAFVGSIDDISVKLLNGNHFVQTALASRPVYTFDGTLRYLAFDGVDDFMLTAIPILSQTPRVLDTFVGVRKNTDASRGMVYEYSVNSASNAGGFSVSAAPTAGQPEWGMSFNSNGTNLTFNRSGFAAPITNVVTARVDASTSNNVLTLGINASYQSSTTALSAAGAGSQYASYIGRRNGASLALNGRIYSLIMRLSPDGVTPLTTQQVAQTDLYVAQKSGVTL